MPDEGQLSWGERLTGRLRRTAPDAAETYDLAIDQQALSLIQLKQQLTYFLITGSTSVIAFVVAFTGSQSSGWFNAITVPSVFALSALAVAGLSVAGLCLLQLYLGHRSFTLHLRYRSQRKTYLQLPQSERDAWDNITKWANRCLTWSFVILFVEILATLLFFWLLVHQMGAVPSPLRP